MDWHLVGFVMQHKIIFTFFKCKNELLGLGRIVTSPHMKMCFFVIMQNCKRFLYLSLHSFAGRG